MGQEISAIFIEAQHSQIFKWLLNPQLYLTVLGLLTLSLLLPVEQWNKRFTVSLMQDYVYGVAYTLVSFPVIMVCVFFVKAGIDTWIPWMNLGLANKMPVLIQFLVIVLLDDVLAYFSHFIRHKIRFLWHFHTVHHAQEHLNVFTTKRFHPFENLFGKVVIKPIPLVIMGSSIEVWTAYYLLDAVWDYFIHSNLKINLGPLNKVIVSPQYHRIHHSRLPQHFDKNFSDRFVIWDILFRTAYLKCDEYPKTGVPSVPFPQENSLSPWGLLTSLLAQWWYPFKMIYRDMVPTRIRSNDN